MAEADTTRGTDDSDKGDVVSSESKNLTSPTMREGKASHFMLNCIVELFIFLFILLCLWFRIVYLLYRQRIYRCTSVSKRVNKCHHEAPRAHVLSLSLSAPPHRGIVKHTYHS